MSSPATGWPYSGEHSNGEVVTSPNFADDRITCAQCLNLANGCCLAAEQIGAGRNYMPVTTILHRCKGYAPAIHQPITARCGEIAFPGGEFTTIGNNL